MARSREIGWGSVNIGLYTFDRDVSCECVPSDATTTTTTTSTTSTTTTTTTTQNPALLCAENWEITYEFNDTQAASQGYDSQGFNDCTVYTLSYSYSPDDYTTIIKRDASGTVLWETSVSRGVAPGDPCYSSDGPGNLIVGTDGSVYGMTDYSLFKLSSTGTLLWYKAFTFTNDFFGWKAFALSTDGYIYAVATRNGNVVLPDATSQPFYLPHVTKFNASTGALVAEKTYYMSTFPEEDINDGPRDIKIDGAGNIIVVHDVTGPPGPPYTNNIIAFKLNSSLGIVWAKRLAPTSGLGPKAASLSIDSSDNIIIADSYGNPNRNSVIKLTSLGALSWCKEISSTLGSYDRLREITVDSSDNIYTGGDLSAGGGIAVVKMSSTGTLSYVMQVTNMLTVNDLAINNTIVGEKLYITGTYVTLSNSANVIKVNSSAMPVGIYGNHSYSNSTANYTLPALGMSSTDAALQAIDDPIVAAASLACSGAAVPSSWFIYVKTVI